MDDFWNNDSWRHADVAWAIFETILMAFLGTMGAAMVALPLAFMAAQNFTPFAAVRFGVRRFFDFLRGVDALIWTIILSRAFGLGPLTGGLAILITDTGSFGKLFSEALENVDEKQIEGVQSTGAKPVQRYRFGVIPQVMPVLLSQVLYFFEIEHPLGDDRGGDHRGRDWSVCHERDQHWQRLGESDLLHHPDPI